MKKRGLLLLNLGTPEAPQTREVRAYLREFLSDPMVIDIPWVFRMLLLYLVILPFRPRKSAEAYQQIWTDDGSPLLIAGRRLQRAVAERIGEGWSVYLGMRYGRPSYAAALAALREEGVEEVVALPLYPQWARSSTGSTQRAVEEWLEDNGRPFQVKWVDSFCVEPGFIAAQVELCKSLPDWDQDEVFWLFSYHGVPEHQVRKVHPQQCVISDLCCASITASNSRCYRAQCFATSKALAKALGLRADQWMNSFQSRIGRTPWLLPSTEETLPALVAEGKRDLRVVCPAFTADCLETLEELDIRGKERFVDAGGITYERASCVNDHPLFVEALISMANAAI